MAARRLGYMVPQFPGQTHAFFWRELRALEAMGVEVALISTRPPPAGVVSHGWAAEAAARTTYLGRPRPADALAALPALPWAELRAREPGFAADLAVALPAAPAYVRAARRLGVGHVHVHSCGRAALVAALGARLGGPSYSLTLHGDLSIYGPGQNLKWRGARFATVVTRRLLTELRTLLRDDLPAAVEVQPMGIDPDRHARPVPYVPARPGETLRIVSVGRLNWAKGHQDLLAALRLLHGRGVAARLEILGEDDLGGTGFRRSLTARIEELGLGAAVALAGAVGEERVAAALAEAHLFALASHQEALSVAVMEAMAAGLPVVTTAVGGMRELVTDGVDGVLVPPRDPAALAEAIAALARDPARAIRLSMAARARVERDFGAERGAEAILRGLGWL
jgi:glycosyltransferase involved in cell wall biosynthesis